MTDKEILFKAVKKAEKNNYEEHLDFFLRLKIPENQLENLLKNIFWAHRYNIIFSHKFAKAFFGDNDEIYVCDAWSNRLQEMSKVENEFKYLEKFLDE